MTSEEITNGNVLIAHFIGLKQGNDWEIRSEIAQWCHPIDLKYNESWDWLIPVVDKIKELKHPVWFYQSHVQNTVEVYSIGSKSYIIRESSTKIKPIELLWTAIINFIEWYYEKNNIEKPKPIQFFE